MGFFGKIIKSCIAVIELPIALAKDTLCFAPGGYLNEKDRSYTFEKLDELGEDIIQIKEEL